MLLSKKNITKYKYTMESCSFSVMMSKYNILDIRILHAISLV